MKIWFCTALLGATLLGCGRAHADGDMVRVFLDLSDSGVAFPANSSRQQMGRGQIECLGYKQSTEVPVTANVGMGTGRARLGPVIIRKSLDGATPLLMQTMLNGRHLKNARFHFMTQLPDGRISELDTVEIQDVSISSIKRIFDNGNTPSQMAPLVEEVSFSFREMVAPTAPSPGVTSAPPALEQPVPSLKLPKLPKLPRIFKRLQH